MSILNTKGFPTTAEIDKNLSCSEDALTVIEASYGKPIRVTSGLRNMADHLRIYKDKGITDITKIPLKSKHLIGAAFDAEDASGQLWAWCMANIPLLEKLGVYLEDRKSTPSWVHFQILPPASGKRIFVP